VLNRYSVVGWEFGCGVERVRVVFVYGIRFDWKFLFVVVHQGFIGAHGLALHAGFVAQEEVEAVGVIGGGGEAAECSALRRDVSVPHDLVAVVVGQFFEGPCAAHAPGAGDDSFDLEPLKRRGGAELVFEFFGELEEPRLRFGAEDDHFA
jgi:hypothetical protein